MIACPHNSLWMNCHESYDRSIDTLRKKGCDVDPFDAGGQQVHLYLWALQGFSKRYARGRERLQ